MEKATENYVNNIEETKKDQLIRDTEDFLKTVEENLVEFNELSWSALSADQVRVYMGKILKEMRKPGWN